MMIFISHILHRFETGGPVKMKGRGKRKRKLLFLIKFLTFYVIVESN